MDTLFEAPTGFASPSHTVLGYSESFEPAILHKSRLRNLRTCEQLGGAAVTEVNGARAPQTPPLLPTTRTTLTHRLATASLPYTRQLGF